MQCSGRSEDLEFQGLAASNGECMECEIACWICAHLVCARGACDSIVRTTRRLQNPDARSIALPLPGLFHATSLGFRPACGGAAACVSQRTSHYTIDESNEPTAYKRLAGPPSKDAAADTKTPDSDVD